MGKRKAVPAALHSELSEYSSLIRALRTNDTLNIVPHLTKSKPTPVSNYDVEREASPGPVAGPSKSVEDTNIADGQPPAKKQKRDSDRDTWTRWPLLADDVHVPEWGFEDEIRILISQSQSRERAYTVLDEEGEALDGSDAEDPDETVERYLSPITEASSAYLARILALLASHTPLAGKSMQNRVAPIGWEMVLCAASDIGVDEKIISSVQKRMQAVYPSPPSQSVSVAVERVRTSVETRRKFDAVYRKFDLSFLDSMPPMPSYLARKSSKRKEVNSVKKSMTRPRRDVPMDEMLSDDLD